MEVEEHVCAVGDDQARGIDLHARLLEGIDLVEHTGEVDHHAVAHDALGLLVEDAGGPARWRRTFCPRRRRWCGPRWRRPGTSRRCRTPVWIGRNGGR